MTSSLTNQPRVDVAFLVSLIFECLLNGVYWLLFYRCNRVLWRRSNIRHESVFKPIFFIGWVLFCTITGHLAIEIYMAFAAFILPQTTTPILQPLGQTPAEVYYTSLYQPAIVSWSAFYVATTVIADAFLIYRLYAVWGYNRYIVIPPSLACLGLLVTGTMVTYLFKNAREPIFGVSRKWILASYVLTFICNFYSTSLIALKLTLSERENIQSHSENSSSTIFHKIFEIMVQSASLYCLLVVLSLALVSISSNLSFITVSITIPVIGIIFSMIVTRTHDHLTQQTAVYSRHHSGGLGDAELGINISTTRTTHRQTFIAMNPAEKRMSGTSGLGSKAPNSIASPSNSPVVDSPSQFT